MKTLYTVIMESADIEGKMWKLIDEINLPHLLDTIKKDADITEHIKKLLQNKLDNKELSKDDLDSISYAIFQKADKLANYEDVWGLADDATMDVAYATVGFGRKEYEKCFTDESHLKSMKKKTREYESFIRAFDEVLK